MIVELNRIEHALIAEHHPADATELAQWIEDIHTKAGEPADAWVTIEWDATPEHLFTPGPHPKLDVTVHQIGDGSFTVEAQTPPVPPAVLELIAARA